MFCSPETPFFICFSTRSLKLSMPGWIVVTPASRSRRT